MLKIYKDYLRRLLLMGLHYRDLDFGMKDAYTYANDNWYNSQRSNYFSRSNSASLKIPGLLRFLEDGEFNERAVSITDLINDLAATLLSDEERNDRDLLDAIVKAVGLPYAKNALSGANLNRLKNALLIPEELAGLKRGLESELSCSRCGHKFEMGEMATFYREDNSTRGFHCSRCYRPTYMAADNDMAQSLPVAGNKPLATALAKKYNADHVADNNIIALADEVLQAPDPPRQRRPAAAIDPRHAWLDAAGINYAQAQAQVLGAAGQDYPVYQFVGLDPHQAAPVAPLRAAPQPVFIGEPQADPIAAAPDPIMDDVRGRPQANLVADEIRRMGELLGPRPVAGRRPR